jgi:glycosyltransferase involved in cell wall biosynthesis
MSKKLKIFHLTGSLSIGGAQRLLVGLVQNLDRERFAIHVYSFGKHREVSFLPDFEMMEDIELTVNPSQSFYNPKALLNILRYLRKYKPDLIQTHMIDADILGRIAGKILSIPVLSTLQNDPQNYDSHRFDRRILARITARYLTTHSVAVSNHIRNLFIEKWKLAPDKLTTIYNAVSLQLYKHIPLPPAEEQKEEIIISNIASLTQQKAQNILLEAAAIVLEKYPKIRFMIVGRGALDAQLKKQAAEMGLTEQVVFTGVRRDIPEILAKTDIFTLSSLWEGLPLAAIEAMAAGRPVVVTNVGGNKELVKDGKTGLVIPAGNVDALAQAYIQLIENPALRAQYAKAGREYVSQVFGIQTITSQYETLYQKILQS